MTAPPLRAASQTHKALAHPARLRILAMLRTGELCACQITAVLDLAPSTVSAHLAELRRAGFLKERRDGRWVHYQLVQEQRVRGVLEVVWKQLERDAQTADDAKVVAGLRAVPVEELCRVHLDLSRLPISRATKRR